MRIVFYSHIFPVESYNGSTLYFWKMDRRQMGAYLCIASNDVPPAVSKRIILSVNCKYKPSNDAEHFEPLVAPSFSIFFPSLLVMI